VGNFQSSDDLLARDSRKCVEELVEAVIPFEIVDEVPEWHTRANEDGSAAKNLRIAMNHGYGAGHRELSTDSTAPKCEA
jgi:hypothetical protein